MLDPSASKVFVSHTKSPSQVWTDKMVVKNKPTLDSSIFPGSLIEAKSSFPKDTKLSVSPNIFEIKFIYLQQQYSTKVLKVNHKYGDQFYKVVVCSKLSYNSPLCWLQHQLKGWVVLFGKELNGKLKWAITSAIECHELLPLLK